MTINLLFRVLAPILGLWLTSFSSSGQESFTLTKGASTSLSVGTHRPEIRTASDGSIVIAVVEPKGPIETRIKHQVYRLDSQLNPIGEPFAITRIAQPYGEPADHRIALVNDEIVVVYQTLNYREGTRPTEGPSEDFATDQSLLLARFTLNGEELFRAPIVDRTSDFEVNNFPDHCLLWSKKRLLVSSGARSRSLHIREVDLEGLVLADHVFSTSSDGISGNIGNSMHQRGNTIGYFSSNSPAGNGALTLTSINEDFELSRLAEMGGNDGIERHFPTDSLMLDDYTLVTYIARSAKQGMDLSTNPYHPRLMVLNKNYSIINDIQLGEKGFAHVHPTMTILQDQLLIAWSKSAESLQKGRSAPQVQIQLLTLPSLLTTTSKTQASASISARKSEKIKGVGSTSDSITPSSYEVFTAEDGTQFTAEVVASNLEIPWGLASASDDRLFVTERPGRVRVIQNNVLLAEPALTLTNISTRDETGLFGITLHPNFDQNHLVYLVYTTSVPGMSSVSRIVRYRELNNTLAQAVVLFEGLPGAIIPNGSRIRFGVEGQLYFTIGDTGDPSSAQDLGSLNGKVFRINEDGTIPYNNPSYSPIFSYGHRNPQGIDWHPLSGDLWLIESGAHNDTELNRIERGGNYGWTLNDGNQFIPGAVEPVLSITPSLDASGGSFYRGNQFPSFRNNWFFGSLHGQHIHRVRFDPTDPRQIVADERLLTGRFGRIRDVITGSDGALYFCTSNRDNQGTRVAGDDRIVRILPVSAN